MLEMVKVSYIMLDIDNNKLYFYNKMDFIKYISLLFPERVSIDEVYAVISEYDLMNGMYVTLIHSDSTPKDSCLEDYKYEVLKYLDDAGRLID